MKIINTITAILLMVHSISCSKDEKKGVKTEPPSHRIIKLTAAEVGVIEPHLSDYFSGDLFVEQRNDGESLRIDGGKIELLKIRQVGRDGTNVPFPTVCSYKMTGEIEELFARSDDERAEYVEYATHEMAFVIQSLVLNDTTSFKSSSDPHCQIFEKEMNSQSFLGYTTYFEVIDENRIRLHTAGGGGYKSGEPKSRGVLDEIFVRTPKK